MSKKPQKKASNFNYVPKQVLPKLTAVKTNWDLKGLYYKSETDPQIEADIRKTEQEYKKFVKKCKGKNFTTSPKTLARALTEKERLSNLPEVSRPGRYFSFRAVLNSNDKVAEKHLALLNRRFQKVSNSILFFTLTLGELSTKEQQRLLRAPELAKFNYYLKRIFANAKHHLSEDQEKIINLKSSQSYGRWVDMTEKVLSNRSIVWDNKKIPLPEASEMVTVVPKSQRNKLWRLLTNEFEKVAEIAEHEFNAIITDVRTEDELRGYKKPYSATALGYEDSEASIENLVSAVSSKGFKLSHKFYKLKAELSGKPTIPYANKYDSIGSEPIIPFEQAVEICRDIFYALKPVYGEIFDTMLLNGQIDVYPKQGKRGGAFMSSETNQPTHVFLNHMTNFKSLETLAHEMGHAIHSERSKQQPLIYQGHSISTAETASTLFENLVFDAVYEQSPEKQRIVLLHDRISRDISTMQRQIAFFNAELEIHNTINEHGAMSTDELRQCMAKHLQSYLGPAVSVDPRDGYSFVYIPHLRYGFYVYTYTFGLLMSTTMANHYKKDQSYMQQIDAFLSSGSSASVADIFKSIGIQTQKSDVYLDALNNHAADIKKFEQFVKAKK
ncbi:MAG: M3 family metallopeptidase [Candidatus Paceibacterota bacterium]